MKTIYILLLGLATTAWVQGALKYDVPKGWSSKPSASPMRVAEFIIPRAAGDSEDGEVAIFFFRGQGGSVEANLERWMNQMSQPDGRSSRDVAKTSQMTVNGLKVTVVDLTGRYVAEIQPGSAQRHNKPDFRMVAAVVETTAGPYFVKVTGPQKTVAQWNGSILEFLKSIRYQ